MDKDPNRYLPRHVWYLADALVLVRTLQAIAWPQGYHIALGGGVLNHGYSDGDLDIYVLPIYNKPGIVDELVILTALGAVLDQNDYVEPVCSFENNPHECFAYSVRFPNGGKRVEIFVVRREGIKTPEKGVF
jgi:hypothetical protein